MEKDNSSQNSRISATTRARNVFALKQTTLTPFRRAWSRGFLCVALLGALSAPAFAEWKFPFFASSADSASSGAAHASTAAPAVKSSRASAELGGEAPALWPSSGVAGLFGAASAPDATATIGGRASRWAEGTWPEWTPSNWMSVAADAPNALGLSAPQIQKWEFAQKQTRDSKQGAASRQEAYQAKLRETARKGGAGLDPLTLAQWRRNSSIQREQSEQAAENAWGDFYASLDPEQQKTFTRLAADRIRRWEERAKMVGRWESDQRWQGTKQMGAKNTPVLGGKGKSVAEAQPVKK